MLYTNIEKYIPQRKPFLLVDNIVNILNDSLVTSFMVDENHVLCKDGIFQESGIIENIAQSAAVMEGYNAVVHNKNIRLGFIGAVKCLEIYDKIISGSTLNTMVKEINDVIGVKIISGEVRVDNKLVAKCNMQIYLKE